MSSTSGAPPGSPHADPEAHPDFYRTVIENAFDIVTVLDRAGTILYESPSLEPNLGYRPGELIGHSVFEVLHADDRAQVEAAMAAVFTEPGTSRRTTVRLRHRDGDWRTLEAVGRFLEGGAVEALVITSRDVTEAHAAQAAVAHSSALFRHVFTAARDVMVLTSPDTGRLLDVNERFLGTFGLTREQAIGRTTLELGLWPVDGERPLVVEELRRTGRIRDRETRFRTPAGDTRLLVFDAEIVEIAGEESMLICATDVTEERRTQAMLRQAQKMEALGQLTGGIAHDFNNLLGVVSGNAELLQPILAGKDDAARQLLEPILDAARRGAELTQQLLAFARRQMLKPEIVPLRRQLRQLEPMLRASLPETIDLTLSLPEPELHVEVDRGQLETALLNLVINARDAMPAGGRLEVALEDAPSSAEPDLDSYGGRVVLRVTDEGVGMTPEVREKVFEPFFTTKSAERGTGLGLSMVHGFVHQSGGSIELDSEPGRGTRVSLLLPATRPGEADAESDAGVRAGERAPAPGLGERVLVVEDDPALRRMLGQALEEHGYRPWLAADPAALTPAHLRSEDVRLIVTDVILAGSESGPAAAARLRVARPGMPILFISGYADADLELAPQDRLLGKPFELDALATLIRKMLDGAPHPEP